MTRVPKTHARRSCWRNMPERMKVPFWEGQLSAWRAAGSISSCRHMSRYPARWSITTFPGDIVLDCFGGGGSTALAALKLKRRTISMEIEPTWASEIASRVEDVSEADIPFLSSARNGNGHSLPRINGNKSRQLALFSVGR